MQRLLDLFLFVTVVGCFVSSPVSGQESGGAIKARIENTRTAGHVNIPGTRVFIVPPPNFKIATSFTGLQRDNMSAMNVMELIGGNFYTNAATFSKSEFQSKGVKVDDFQEISINGYPAKYISMQGDASTKFYGVVFGDTTFSTMIMAMYPATDEATGRAVVNSLNTIFYDKHLKIDPLAAAYFSLDDKVSKFKFSKGAATAYLYTVGGADIADNQDDPFIVVTQLPREGGMTLKSLADQMIEKGKEYGWTDFETKSSSARKINGYDAYETEVDVKISGVKTRNYYLVVGKDDKAIVIMGTTKKDFENNVVEFKKIAGSVQFK